MDGYRYDDLLSLVKEKKEIANQRREIHNKISLLDSDDLMSRMYYIDQIQSIDNRMKEIKEILKG